jgi:enamine deaminase RidA (YjgF/YER057c/UK114 family)
MPKPRRRPASATRADEARDAGAGAVSASAAEEEDADEGAGVFEELDDEDVEDSGTAAEDESTGLPREQSLPPLPASRGKEAAAASDSAGAGAGAGAGASAGGGRKRARDAAAADGADLLVWGVGSSIGGAATDTGAGTGADVGAGTGAGAGTQPLAGTRQPPVRAVRIPGGSLYEPVVGYSRAVVAGGVVRVSGTTASSAGGPLEPCAGAQAAAALGVIARVLAQAGASVRDVVRTRMYVVDIARNADAVGRAHGAVFGAVRPAASMVGVSALIDERMLVEIEADAVIGAGGGAED